MLDVAKKNSEAPENEENCQYEFFYDSTVYMNVRKISE